MICASIIVLSSDSALSEKDDCLVIYKRAIPSVTQLSYTVSFMSSKWMFSYRPLHMAQP